MKQYSSVSQLMDELVETKRLVEKLVEAHGLATRERDAALGELARMRLLCQELTVQLEDLSTGRR